MIIIGLLGKAGSGKSTIAKHLQSKGFRIISFADPIKELAREYFSLTTEEVYETKPPHARTILQGLGSFIREQIDENWIVNEAVMKMKYSENHKFVIDDIRLEEEAKFIKEIGGLVVKIECPDSPQSLTEGQKQHITEQIDAIPFDKLIHAPYGSVAKLTEGIEEILKGCVNAIT